MYGVNLTLNLDFRVKSNRMKGVFDLPHSIGKQVRTAALTFDDELKVEAMLHGAVIAGDLDYQLRKDRIDPDLLERVVATDDLEFEFRKSSRLRSRLKKAKLLPDVDYKTLVPADDFSEAVYKHTHGIFRPYSTDRHGNVTTALGQMRMEESQIAENLTAVLEQIFRDRPDCFGTGPSRKLKHMGVFVLGMHITSSKNLSLPLDLDSFPILQKKNRRIPPGGDELKVSKTTLKSIQNSL